MTDEAWVRRMENYSDGKMPVDGAAQKYLTHKRVWGQMSEEGQTDICNWIKNVGPAGPFEPVQSFFKVDERTLEAFPPREPERFLLNRRMPFTLYSYCIWLTPYTASY
jgi:hypothetical protein